VQSAPFVAKLFILGLKAGISALITANLVDTKDEGNLLSVPTLVPAPVIVCQFLAIFIAVAAQGKYIPNKLIYRILVMRKWPYSHFSFSSR
jgi:hypothetical protein